MKRSKKSTKFSIFCLISFNIFSDSRAFFCAAISDSSSFSSIKEAETGFFSTSISFFFSSIFVSFGFSSSLFIFSEINFFPIIYRYSLFNIFYKKNNTLIDIPWN